MEHTTSEKIMRRVNLLTILILVLAFCFVFESITNMALIGEIQKLRELVELAFSIAAH